MKEIVLIGYSGHAYVVYDIFQSMAITVVGYCDREQKKNNPYKIKYLGQEDDKNILKTLNQYDYFVAIGDNEIRKKVQRFLSKNLKFPVNAIHTSSVVSPSVEFGTGCMVSPNATINAYTTIMNGVICNTSSTVEHECKIGDFSHIAPGAVLGGNVEVGYLTLIGANAVVKPGVKVGNKVVIGAGSVIIKDVPNNSKVVGNPQRYIE